jgi:hypothetical protein
LIAGHNFSRTATAEACENLGIYGVRKDRPNLIQVIYFVLLAKKKRGDPGRVRPFVFGPAYRRIAKRIFA